jgi:hypothetical protein
MCGHIPARGDIRSQKNPQSSLYKGETCMKRTYRDRAGRKKKNSTKRRQTNFCENHCLQLKGDTWHAVMSIPRDVQYVSKNTRKKRFTASLKTSDVSEAIDRLPKYINRWHSEIASLRRAQRYAWDESRRD